MSQESFCIDTEYAKAFLIDCSLSIAYPFCNFFNGVLIFIRDSSYLNLVSRWYLHFLRKQELVRPIVKAGTVLLFLKCVFIPGTCLFHEWLKMLCSNHFMYSLSSNRSFNRRILNEDGLISAVSKFVRIQTVQFDAISYSDQVGAELPCSHHSFCC